MSDANEAFVKSLYAAYGKGDIPTVLAGLAPDVEWHSGGRAEDFPAFGSRKGHKPVEEFFKTVAANIEFSEFSPREFYAVGDKVFVLGHYAMTLRKNARQAASEWVHNF